MSIPTAEQKLQWLKPAPLAKNESECVDKLATGEFEVGFERTNNILDEAMEVFERSARTSMGIAGDSMVALFTASGDLANASCGTYLHAVIQPVLIKFILNNYAENPGINDGDIWFTNDALYGGIHNPDQVCVMPIFYKDELIGWAGAANHTTETGAIEPGGMPITATSRFAEGMNFPPIKIGENFRIKNDFLELLSAFAIRAPQMVIIDLKARASAADRVRKRIVEMAEDKGGDYVKGLLRKMLMAAENGARKRIRSFPDGKYRCVNFADSVGFESGLLRTAYLTLTKEDDQITLDFSGTSPETPYSYNAHVQAVVGHISNFVFEYVFHDLPISNATFASINFIFPKGSCLNPDIRAATSNSVMISTGVMSSLHNCFSKMMMVTNEHWKQVSASQGNAGNAMVLSGLSQWKLPFADMLAYSLNSEGQGARATKDGVNAFGFPWCVFGRTPDVEEMENEFPITIPLSNHWKDSCGHGKYRGGVGTIQVWVAHHTQRVYFMAIADNSKIQTPQPLFGGYAPGTVPGISATNTDFYEKMSSGSPDLTWDFRELIKNKTIKGQWSYEYFARATRPFSEGDIITFGFATGGSGYGDPLDRDPELVIKDLRDEVISHWSAKNIYKVAYDEKRLKVNQEETRKLREEEKKARLKRGKPYSEFGKEWVKKKPPEAILKFYGSWPDAKVLTHIFRP
ncbi:MAG: hydantoinase B/oxoprolinase family protein [Pseudomonadota bacterium]